MPVTILPLPNPSPIEGPLPNPGTRPGPRIPTTDYELCNQGPYALNIYKPSKGFPLGKIALTKQGQAPITRKITEAEISDVDPKLSTVVYRGQDFQLARATRVDQPDAEELVVLSFKAEGILLEQWNFSCSKVQ